MKQEFIDASSLIEKAVEDGDICGAALAIGCKNQVYIKKCFGHVSIEENAEEVNENTAFDMASMSKILGPTMIALKLLDSGRIGLSDTLEDCLEAGYLNLASIPEDKKNITIKNLMTHTSGIAAYYRLWDFINSPDEAVDFILKQPLVYETGKGQQYTCMGYITLAKILEGFFKKPLDQIAKEQVFDVLQMNDTSYHRLLKGYKALYDISPNTMYTEKDPFNDIWLAGTVHDENARFLNGVSGNAGVFSTLNDVIKYATMLSNRGMLGEERFLSENIFCQAIKNYTKGFNQNRGLGFHLAGDDCYSGDMFDRNGFGHTGFTGTSILVSPTTGLYAILLTNRVHPTRDNDKLFPIRHRFHDILSPLSLNDF